MDNDTELEERKPKGRPQVRRERAELLLSKILLEAQAINDDATMNYSVVRLSVFGSYLTDKAVLGDLDIAVLLKARWDAKVHGQYDAMLKAFLAAYPPAPSRSDFINRLLWPQVYIFRRLRVGRGVSLHDEHEIAACGFEMRTLFEADAPGCPTQPGTS